jgi:hypothetical protein
MHIPLPPSRRVRRLLMISGAALVSALPTAAIAHAGEDGITVGGGQFTITTVEGDIECTTTVSNEGTKTKCVMLR